MAFFDGQLANMAKLHAAQMDQSYGQARYAIVREYDPETNMVLVAYYNPVTDADDLLSGWLPLLVPFLGLGDDTDAGSGPSWGIVDPPNIGQRVIVMCQGGDFNSGLVVGGSYSDISPVPTIDGEYTQDGEYLIKHKSGSFLKFYNNGDVKIYADEDVILESQRDMFITAGRDMTIKVGRNLSFEVLGTSDMLFFGDVTQNVQANLTLGVLGTMTEAVKKGITVGTDGQLTLISQQTNIDSPEVDMSGILSVPLILGNPDED